MDIKFCRILHLAPVHRILNTVMMIYRIDPSSGTLDQWTDTFTIYRQCQDALQEGCSRPTAPCGGLPPPPARSLHSSHRPAHPPKALCTDPQLPGALHLHLRPPAPCLRCRLGSPLRDSVLLLPPGIQSCRGSQQSSREDHSVSLALKLPSDHFSPQKRQTQRSREG